MLDLADLGLQILQYCCLLNDVVGKLLPLHVPVPIYVYLVEQVSEVPDQGNVSVRRIYLPELQVLFGYQDELVQIELVVFGMELLLQKLDSQLVEVQGHVCDHLVVPGFY